MRRAIIDLLCASAPPEQAARARALIGAHGNVADQLLAIGFAPAAVLNACCEATGLPPAAPQWLKNPRPPPRTEGLDVLLCRRLQAAPVAAMGGRLCIAWADPEMAVQHAELGLPPHAPYLALSSTLVHALLLLPEHAGPAAALAPTAESAMATVPTASALTAPSSDDAPATLVARVAGASALMTARQRPTDGAAAGVFIDPELDAATASVDVGGPLEGPPVTAADPAAPVTAADPPPLVTAADTAPPVTAADPARAAPTTPASSPAPSAPRVATSPGRAPVRETSRAPRAPAPAPPDSEAATGARSLVFASALLLLVAIVAAGLAVTRGTAPSAGVAARIRADAPVSGPAARQHELLARSVAAPDPATAIALLDEALRIDAHGVQERDARLEHARRSLEVGAIESAEGDLLLVTRRPDAREVDEELRALFEATQRARMKRKR